MTGEELTIQVLELLGTVMQASLQLYQYVELNDSQSFDSLGNDMTDALQVMQEVAADDRRGLERLEFTPCFQSLTASLQTIRTLFYSNREKCLHKIEFEFLPLIKDVTLQFYYWEYARKTPERLHEYQTNWMLPLIENPYLEEAERTGCYKYEVTFIVMAYNKLEYTKRCVESLLVNIPVGLNYELIFLNHGSTDGTKEYFESVQPDKQLDIAVNQGGAGAVWRIVEGKYTIMISNDVVVTPYAIENLIKCIRSDPQIAWAVPTTPNVSNLQTIPANYNTEQELELFAEENNHTDLYRWEQRVRLCNPIDIRRNSVFYSAQGLRLNSTDYSFDNRSFTDDRVSLLLRRAGYKMMLVKDAYCHHFGSVTLKDEIKQRNEQQFYEDGRKEFQKVYGVDPWGTGFCYDIAFMQRLVGEERGHVEILGINCGLGSNSLKMKEQLKEYCHNLDTVLYNLTDDPRYLSDLRGVSDEAKLTGGIQELKEFLDGKTVHYIVWEDPYLEQYAFKAVLDACVKSLAPGGRLLLKQNRQNKGRRFSGEKKLEDGWVLVEKRGEALS